MAPETSAARRRLRVRPADPAAGEDLAGTTPAATRAGEPIPLGSPARPAPLLIIEVYGTPAPQGSKRHVGHGVMIESSKKVQPWREAVKYAALEQTRDYLAAPLDGPVCIEAVFTFNKPRSAPKKRRTWPTTRSSGDLDKLLRSTFDALTDAAVWTDDSRVVDCHAYKVFADAPHPDALPLPGAILRIWEVTAP